MSQRDIELAIFCKRARSYAVEGRFKDAFDLLSDVIEAHPGYAPAYADRGTTNAMGKNFPQALADLEAAVQLGCQAPSIYTTLGTVQLQLNRPKAALEAFAKALALDPDYALTYYNRAAAHEKTMNKAAAVLDLRQCLALESDPGFKKVVEERMAELAGVQHR